MSYSIDCRGNIYRIGDKIGRVPGGYDCLIEDFHVVDGKVVKEGIIMFIPKKKSGKTEFILDNGNIFE